MEGLKLIPMVFIIIAVIGFIASASIMALGDFSSSMADNTTIEHNATISARDTLATTTTLFPTVVWIAIVAILITILMGTIAYLNFR